MGDRMKTTNTIALLTAVVVLMLSGPPVSAATEPKVATQATELPITLRLPVAGKSVGRILVVSRLGKLLRGPDLQDVLRYELRGGRLLPMPAQATNGLWGYLDAQGNWAATPQYGEAKMFGEDGLARVKTKTGWGFLDSNLKMVVPATFDSVDGMVKGRAVFRKGGKFGYIDDKGAIVIPARYDLATRFAANGLACFRDGDTWGYLDRNGKVVIAPRFSATQDFDGQGVAPVKVDDKLWGVIDQSGKWVLKPTYEHIEAYSEAGLAAVRNKDFATGFIDRTGKTVIKPTNGLSRYIGGGLIRQGGEGDSRVKYLNVRGEVAIAGPFEMGGHFNEAGLTVARRDGRWGILSRDGKFAVPPRHVEPFTRDDSMVGFDPDSALIPWLTTDGAVEWLDAGGRTQFRIEGQPAGKGRTALKLVDAKGQIVWQDPAFAGSLLARPVLELTAQQLLSDPNQWTGVAKTVQSLLKAKPRRFVAPHGWERDRDPYVMPEDADEAKEMARHGAIQVLSSDYVSEEEWGTYYFLDEQRASQYRKLIRALKDRLEEAFGPPEKGPTDDYSLGGGDHAERFVWRVGKQIVVLEMTVAYGDGDITHSLVVAAIQPRRR